MDISCLRDAQQQTRRTPLYGNGTDGRTDKTDGQTVDCFTDRPTQTMHYTHYTLNCGWRRGVVVSGVRRMNEVNARRARLVLGWVTVFGWVYHLGM